MDPQRRVPQRRVPHGGIDIAGRTGIDMFTQVII
jgi:hypothetical protein